MPAIVVKSSAPTITGEPLMQPGAGDDPVGGDLAADERAEFAERARVEESLDARPRVELALAAVLVEPLRPAHVRACVRRRSRSSSVSSQSWAFVMLLSYLVRMRSAYLEEQGHILDCLL